MAMALMVSARLWLGGVINVHRDKDLIRQLADRVRACARPGDLPVAVDGLAASVNAFLGALRRKAPRKAPGRPHLAPWEQVVIGQVVKQYERGAMAPWRDGTLVRIGQIGRIPGWIGSTRTSWQTRLLLIRTAWSPS